MENPFLNLRRLLWLDAASCAASGPVLAVTAGPAAGLTGLPAPLVFWAGLALIPAALFMVWAARSMPIQLWAVRVIVIGNLTWIIFTLTLPLSSGVEPSPLGWLFLIGQAIFVAVLTLLEHRATRWSIAEGQGAGRGPRLRIS